LLKRHKPTNPQTHRDTDERAGKTLWEGEELGVEVDRLLEIGG